MKKHGILLMLFSIVIAISAANTIDEDPKAVQKWFKNLPHAKEKLTNLHFYFHDVRNGENTTVVQAAQANTTSASPTLFGAVFVMDDPLTKGPDPNSKMVGRAHGIYAFVSQERLGYLMTFNFVFNDGSSLSVVGHNPILEEYRELPILGGSGVFRLARGVATAKTYFRNATTRNSIVEYHLVVLHY